MRKFSKKNITEKNTRYYNKKILQKEIPDITSKKYYKKKYFYYKKKYFILQEKIFS